MAHSPIPFTPASRMARSLGIVAGACLLVLGLSACDRRSESNPGATPAAVGSGEGSSGRSDAGTPSSGVEVVTPSAPDARGGGSSGFKGSVPTADTSGGPSSGSTSPGASNSAPMPPPGVPTEPGSAARGTTPLIPPRITTNDGVPASALGSASASSSGTTNSTPASNTGSR